MNKILDILLCEINSRKDILKYNNIIFDIFTREDFGIVINRLEYFSNFSENWNGINSSSPSEACIAKTLFAILLYFLICYKNKFNVGLIQLILIKEGGINLEIYIEKCSLEIEILNKIAIEEVAEYKYLLYDYNDSYVVNEDIISEEKLTELYTRFQTCIKK